MRVYRICANVQLKIENKTCFVVIFWLLVLLKFILIYSVCCVCLSVLFLIYISLIVKNTLLPDHLCDMEIHILLHYGFASDAAGNANNHLIKLN